MKTTFHKILAYLDLNKGEENKPAVLEDVKLNIVFKGSNLWILACAIFVASVGLNVNSTAVVIGAMLISPLMGPIVGAGFGIGIHDFELLKNSLKNLFIATVVGLIVSGTYFYFSPFKEAQSELLSRTSPNIYDVFIAFFGGLSGAVAITREEKGNPIPGVAIATALMPPLCTAGYGLALWNIKFFLGAMYLYSINSVFICIATFFIVKFLKYPVKKQLDEESQQRVKIFISLLVLVLIVPSIYFAYQLIQERRFKEQIILFTENEFSKKGDVIIYKKTKFNESPRKIELGFLDKKFDKKEIEQLNEKLKIYNLDNTKLVVIQDTTDLKSDILNEIKFNQSATNEKDITILGLKKQLETEFLAKEKLEAAKYNNQNLLAEIKILFPEIEDISISDHVFYENTDSTKTIPVLIYKSIEDLQKSDEEVLISWIKQRLNKKQIKIFRQNN